MNEIQQVFKGLGHSARLRILNLIISDEEICVADLQRILHFSQTKVSRHLIYLKHCGWLDDHRQGACVFYLLKKNPPPAILAVQPILDSLFMLDPQFLQDRQLFNKMKAKT